MCGMSAIVGTMSAVAPYPRRTDPERDGKLYAAPTATGQHTQSLTRDHRSATARQLVQTAFPKVEIYAFLSGLPGSWESGHSRK
jgi:hypothetical protein